MTERQAAAMLAMLSRIEQLLKRIEHHTNPDATSEPSTPNLGQTDEGFQRALDLAEPQDTSQPPNLKLA